MKYVLLIFISFLLDRISKVILISVVPLHDKINIIPGFFNINHVVNDGAAFSILSGNVSFLIFITIISLALITYFYLFDKNTNKTEKVVISILIGGILGNLYDRIVYGHVIDFLDFKIFSYNFPVFNIADTIIVLSAFGLCYLTFSKVGEESEQDTSQR